MTSLIWPRNYGRREGDIAGDRDSSEGYRYEPAPRGGFPTMTNFQVTGGQPDVAASYRNAGR